MGGFARSEWLPEAALDHDVPMALSGGSDDRISIIPKNGVQVYTTFVSFATKKRPPPGEGALAIRPCYSPAGRKRGTEATS